MCVKRHSSLPSIKPKQSKLIRERERVDFVLFSYALGVLKGLLIARVLHLHHFECESYLLNAIHQQIQLIQQIRASDLEFIFD